MEGFPGGQFPTNVFADNNVKASRLERLNELKISSIRPRHYAVFFLLIYIIFECIVIGSSITSGTSSTYVIRLNYNSFSNTARFYPDAVTKVEVRVGYFSSCLKASNNETTSGWSCGDNEPRLLEINRNFEPDSTPNQDLLNFIQLTATKFREECLTPYILLVSILLSFFTIVLFAFVSPTSQPKMYQFSTGICYIGFSLALVAAVWQETNVLTGKILMASMEDDYFGLETNAGVSARVLIWFGVALLLVSCFALGFLAIKGKVAHETSRSIEKDFGGPSLGGPVGGNTTLNILNSTF
ncbi:Fig1 domain-containing protein ASCRUDRAFT_78505 [Ascoidea rubescens DSM 1968]|uniref:Uncharacterized protein n=1 Tax=Ascoidea rubescens DSM 1968 TaxID=1344418 RepID=A0A1D2VP60_9ASCO|nr:hypothetical protein ASCRUDRAFT_78505 [Ascoidea rubescens DSM 1968]ODV63386.1 hypothetical protein ASCRUDRAFT_78505 [Ascoidea rubescens DSM 1968]